MSDRIKRVWLGALASRWALPVMIGALGFGVLSAWATDDDNDGMSDSFETFFGLDIATNDAALDPDDDTLSNIDESSLWTDPLWPDTDRDGFADGSDSNPVSRAYIPWGNPFFSGTNNDVFYTWPNWMVSGFKNGGDWDTNPPAWHVTAAETNPASLAIELDRAFLTNDLRLKVGLAAGSEATLFLDLIDSNGLVIVTNALNNLLLGVGTGSVRIFSIPLETNVSAMGLWLRRGTGDVTVSESLLYIDLDGDGLDADQERQLGSSDLSLDSDLDGFSDAEEVFTYGTDPAQALSVPYGAVQGLVSYAGVQTGVVCVVAAPFPTVWTSLWSAVSYQPTDYNLYVPQRRSYNFRAYRDVNGNGQRETWEPCGTASPSSLYLVSAVTGGVNIVMSDPDTDGDGMSDAAEIRFGFDPFISNGYVRLPFVESFETNTVLLGDIGGQNGWQVSATNAAFVQSNSVYAGSQALELIATSNSAVTVSQFFAKSATNQVWVDIRTTVQPGAAPTGGIESASGFFFNDDATRLVVLDGLRPGTNRWVELTNGPALVEGDWARVSVRMDFALQTWLVCLNGVKVADGLGFGVPLSELHALEQAGACGNVDEIVVSADVPAGFSVDDDALPDDWEMANFGNLEQGDTSDYDQDGLSNLEEFQRGTDPADPDSDHDGLPDGWEIAHGFNPEDAADGVLDSDNDGLTNAEEFNGGTDPWNADSDSDGLPDGWETINGFDPTDPANSILDADNDGLTNLQEFQLGTHPWNADTDGDGLPDGWETTRGFAPLDAEDGIQDSDNDGLSNPQEYQHGTDYANPDSDHDGLADGVEVNTYGTNPLSRDTDQDGLSDTAEVAAGTDPLDSASNDWTAWQHRRIMPVRDTGRTTALTNFPVLVVLNPTRVDYSQFSADGADLRFADTEGRELTHEIESWNTNGDSYLWVRVPMLPADGSGAWLTMVWGNPVAPVPAQSAGVWNEDYAGVWHLADTYRNVLDSTRHHWDGIARGTDLAAGHVGGARHFDGGGQIEIPSTAFSAIGQGVSLSLWLRGDDARRPAGAAFQGVWNMEEELMCLMPNSYGSVTWQALRNSCSKTPLSQDVRDQWNHWVFTKNPQSGAMAIYLNGALWLQASGAAHEYRRIDTFRLGSQWDGCAGYHGVIDEFRVSNVVRSPDWIRAEYASMTDGLLSGYGVTPQDEGAASIDPAADVAAVSSNEFTIMVSKPGVDTSYRSGLWGEADGVLVAQTNCGMRAEYTFTPPEAGMYRLAVRIENAATNALPVTFSLHALLNRGFGGPALESGIRWLDVTVPSGTNACGFLITPWLAATNQTLRLAWLDDYAANKMLAIRAIELHRIDGTDADMNGLPDWMDTILAKGYDTDRDGLTDASERAFGLCPLVTDSDGDTLGDGEEQTVFGVNPSLADTDANGTPDAHLVLELNGVDTGARDSWVSTSMLYEDGTSLVFPQPWASADYDITVATAGVYRLGLQLRNAAADMPDDYRFSVQASLNGCEIGAFKVFADTDRSGTAYLNTPWLTPGAHRIRLQWLNWFRATRHEPDQRQRHTEMAIEKVRLYAVDGVDSDTNGVPNWAETALRDLGDTDGDGLSDWDEVMVYHSNPFNKDTDGDGLSDKDEIARGTDPNIADTDGDGVLDGEEVWSALTNPLNPEFDGTVVDVDVVQGSSSNAAAGSWKAVGTELESQCLRGFVDYIVNSPTADVFRIKINATHRFKTSLCSPVAPIGESDIQVYVDGRYMGKKHLVAPDGNYGSVDCFTSWLPAGSHVVRVFWENVHSRLSLKIRDVRLQQLGGPDANGNGVKDWVEASVLAQSGWDTPPAESVVSPVCIEGAGHYIDRMVLTSCGTTGTVKNGILGRWYADVPLAPMGGTSIDVSYQDGVVVRSNTVTWTALNLLTAVNMKIRKDDALKLIAYPEGVATGSVQVIVEGVTNAVTTVGEPVICAFTNGGTYTVTGIYDDGVCRSNSIVVTVVDGAFPSEPPACLIGNSRRWTCTNMPYEAVLEADPSVWLNWAGQVATIVMSAINEDHYMVARAYPNGPIIASTRLDGFWVQGAADSYMWVVERYPDSQLWENTMVTKRIPSSVSIQIRIIVGGVTFDDMALERWLSAADLGATGDYKFRMIRPNSVTASTCHTIKAYQGGEFIGEAYYGGILMPVE